MFQLAFGCLQHPKAVSKWLTRLQIKHSSSTPRIINQKSMGSWWGWKANFCFLPEIIVASEFNHWKSFLCCIQTWCQSIFRRRFNLVSHWTLIAILWRRLQWTFRCKWKQQHCNTVRCCIFWPAFGSKSYLANINHGIQQAL